MITASPALFKLIYIGGSIPHQTLYLRNIYKTRRQRRRQAR
jgi:hypothetical protein